MAHPIRWVKETLPPRPRARWLLTTIRLSISSFAGMARTLVAVGTPRLLSILATTRADPPLIGVGTTAAGVAATCATGTAAGAVETGAACAGVLVVTSG
ncbi:unannotated protein [freshwater metagenome]|uniref:Unannotated protein n=1 Tax=freshwater metagenome TaxID=449393 RepID=A0A6J7BYL9_9ZZZZ